MNRRHHDKRISAAADSALTVLRGVLHVAQGIVASIVLVALTVGVPWALWHWIGWPLPSHVPTRESISALLQGPTTATMMLDLLACLCWAVWAAFAFGVVRSVLAAACGLRLPVTSTVGPVHALAAVLVGMVLVGLLGSRHPTSAPDNEGAAGTPAVVLADSTQPHIGERVVVRSPHDGIHDSLWRIAERSLGDPTRWPEIFTANQGSPQPTGAPFTNPNLIYPGEQLLVPTDHAPDPIPADASHTDPTPTTAPSPDLPATTPALSHTPGHQDRHSVSWGSEVFVGLGLAAAISAALTVARRRQARDYQPGSGRRDDLNPAPVIYQLHHAHLAAARENPGEQVDLVPADPPAEATPTGRDEHGAGGTPLGVRDGDTLSIDLAAARGLGLVGSGAAAAVRALLLALLTDNPDTTALIPADDLTTLLGTSTPDLPAGVRVVDTLTAALDELETETRRRAHNSAQSHWPPLVLIAATPAADHPKLQAVLDKGSPLAVAAVLLGQWRPGITAYIRDDGTVSATSPGIGKALRGTLFRLGIDHATALLDLLRTAQSTPASPTPDPEPAAGPRPHPAAQIRPPEPDLEIVAAPPATVTPTPIHATDPEPHRAGHDQPEPAASTAYPITIRVLGSLQLHWHPHSGDHGPCEIAGVLQPRARELVTLLALHPDGLTREALIDALWPTNPPARPANALHTALTRLRHAMTDAIDSDIPDIVATGRGTHYRLDPTVVDVDYWHFERAVAARRAATTDQARVAAYRRITGHYTGPLADGLSTDWIEPAREAARRDFIDAVATLARALVDHDPQQTLDLLETARRLDPHNELLYRDIMRLQHRLGRAEAVPRTLSLLTTRLTEIGEAPATQTQQLAAQIRGTPTARTA